MRFIRKIAAGALNALVVLLSTFVSMSLYDSKNSPNVLGVLHRGLFALHIVL
jgi:hypothetical protein